MTDAEGLTRGLLVAGHEAARLLERHLDGTSLSAGEAVLITALATDGLTMSGVMAALNIKASTATSLVGRLEHAGLVVRTPNEDDRRSLLVTLTESGRDLLRTVQPIFETIDEAILRSAGPRPVAGHREVLAVVRDLP